MIAAAIVCAAACSQAAKVDWSLGAQNSIMLQDGSAAKGLAVYLINTKAADYATLTADLASGKATAANIGAKDTYGNYIYSAYLGEAATGTSNPGAGKITKATATMDSIIAGGDVYARFVAFDSNTDGNWYYLSNESTGVGYDGSETYPTGTTVGWNATNYSASNWHEVSAVPEPTSGLLLLLGVAGLALRRKRA